MNGHKMTATALNITLPNNDILGSKKEAWDKEAVFFQGLQLLPESVIFFRNTTTDFP